MTLVVEGWSLYHLEHVVPVNSIRSQTQELSLDSKGSQLRYSLLVVALLWHLALGFL